MSCHFITLLSARLVWDGKVKAILDDINQEVQETVEYMAEGLRKSLMSRRFRRPGKKIFLTS